MINILWQNKHDIFISSSQQIQYVLQKSNQFLL